MVKKKTSVKKAPVKKAAKAKKIAVPTKEGVDVVMLQTQQQLMTSQQSIIKGLSHIIEILKSSLFDSFLSYVLANADNIGNVIQNFMDLFSKSIHLLGITEQELLASLPEGLQDQINDNKTPAKATKGKAAGVGATTGFELPVETKEAAPKVVAEKKEETVFSNLGGIGLL